jgi:hypothetical protein
VRRFADFNQKPLNRVTPEDGRRVSSAPCAHYAAFWAGFSLGGAYGCGSEVVRVARCAV